MPYIHPRRRHFLVLRHAALVKQHGCAVRLFAVILNEIVKLADNKFSAEKSLADEWILSRYQQIIKKTDDALQNFYFGDMAQGLYDFVWSEFCDWYIEMSKLGLHRETFLTIFNGILQLLHPLTPFITEELWEIGRAHV